MKPNSAGGRRAGAACRAASSPLQGPRVNPELGLLSELSFTCSPPASVCFFRVLRFPPTSHKHAGGWPGKTNLPQGAHDLLVELSIHTVYYTENDLLLKKHL